MPRDIYNIYELRQEIQQKICQKKWEEAKQCLLEYEKNKRAKEPLHQQFIEQEYAQIAWLRGKSVETVCEHLEKAIVQTMPEAEIQRKTGILSAEEYKLLLFRWEVCFGTDRERGEKELQELVEEIFQKNFERTERVKVIPYAALLIEKTARDGKADNYLKLITETALENLREEGKLLYMPEILEQYAQILEKENIFVMDESRASHQDIRPIQILILNLMPLKEETELQLLRSLSNTPLQVDVTFMAVQSHEAKNTSVSHLNKFYQTFPELKNNKYDGMISTGAPVEQMEFEEVDYWKELVKIMDWTNTHVTSTIYLCWAAQAGLYHHYGLKKRKLDKKMFGLFWHKVMNRKIPLVRGFDDMFLAPHSRHTEVPIEDIHNCKELTVLAESDEAGLFLAMADGGRKIFVMGHPEYDRVTLDGEYKRDVSKNLPIEIPENYYKDNNPENRPLLMWRAHANNLYTNWLNYYVYQSTPFDLYGTPDFEHI